MSQSNITDINYGQPKYAPNQTNPAIRRCRFIVHTADSSALIRINRSHEDRPEAGWPVGVTFMVTRRGWERGPVPRCERDEWATMKALHYASTEDASPSCHPEPQRRVYRAGRRDASTRYRHLRSFR
jgi:hypothetical protein